MNSKGNDNPPKGDQLSAKGEYLTKRGAEFLRQVHGPLWAAIDLLTRKKSETVDSQAADYLQRASTAWSKFASRPLGSAEVHCAELLAELLEQLGGCFDVTWASDASGAGVSNHVRLFTGLTSHLADWLGRVSEPPVAVQDAVSKALRIWITYVEAQQFTVPENESPCAYHFWLHLGFDPKLPASLASCDRQAFRELVVAVAAVVTQDVGASQSNLRPAFSFFQALASDLSADLAEICDLMLTRLVKSVRPDGTIETLFCLNSILRAFGLTHPEDHPHADSVRVKLGLSLDLLARNIIEWEREVAEPFSFELRHRRSDFQTAITGKRPGVGHKSLPREFNQDQQVKLIASDILEFEVVAESLREDLSQVCFTVPSEACNCQECDATLRFGDEHNSSTRELGKCRLVFPFHDGEPNKTLKYLIADGLSLKHGLDVQQNDSGCRLTVRIGHLYVLTPEQLPQLLDGSGKSQELPPNVALEEFEAFLKTEHQIELKLNNHVKTLVFA